VRRLTTRFAGVCRVFGRKAGPGVGLVAVTLTLLATNAPLNAESAPPVADKHDEVSRSLQDVRARLETSQAREKTFESRLTALEQESQALSDKLAGMAARIQAYESKITSSETRVKDLNKREVLLLEQLGKRRRAIAELLAGLQRLERNPPPPLAAHPDDALAAIRGATLFAAIVPELRRQSTALAQSLGQLEGVRYAQTSERGLIERHVARLRATRAEIATLLERKKELAEETRQSLQDERAVAAELGRKATSLSELLSDLARQRRLAEQRVEEEARKAVAEAEKAKLEAERKERERIARLNQPRMAFTAAYGKIEYPAQGKRIREFGDKDGFGSLAKGLYILTRKEAQVTAPADARIEYAGDFRSYGGLLILDVGEGYHILLAGLGQISAETGQYVRAGEPLGLMGESPARGTLIGDRMEERRPILYVEFRKNGDAISPKRWWIGNRREARG